MRLVIGNKNLSSWSLRPWLVMKHAGLPFEEELVLFETPGWRDAITSHSPSGRVPALRDGELVVWDSLAICEYLADRFPQARLWPDDAAQRALARSVSAEVHAGFTSLRREMPMDVTARHPRGAPSTETETDIRRVLAIWEERAGGGAFLFGRFSIADAMFAPVVFRFRTYDVPVTGRAREYYEAMLALPAMQEWDEAAAAEVRDARAAAAARPAGATPDPRSAQHCFAVVFSSQRTAGHGEEYEAEARRMVALAGQQPGFLGVESARGADGFGITVSYWESLEAVRHFRDVGEHRAAQARGRESYYERYQVRVCTVERGYEYPPKPLRET